MKNYEAREAQITGKTQEGEWRVRTQNAAGLAPGMRLWIQPIVPPSAALRQKRMIWALIAEIVRYQGEKMKTGSRSLKLDFVIHGLRMQAIRLFSLGDAPQELIADYQRYLVHFVIDHEIPTKKPLIAYTDDIADYIAYCMEEKKCAVCGRPASLFALDGEKPRLQQQALGLCAIHGAELRQKGAAGFLKKYRLQKGVPLDAHMARRYGHDIREGDAT